MTIPQVLIALLIVLPIGYFGAWFRRLVMRTYQRDLTSWLALASVVLFALAATAYYWPPASFSKINSAIVLALLSSLSGFVSLGARMLRKGDSPLLSAAVYCLFSLPLIAATVFVLFVLVWSGAHLNR